MEKTFAKVFLPSLCTPTSLFKTFKEDMFFAGRAFFSKNALPAPLPKNFQEKGVKALRGCFVF